MVCDFRNATGLATSFRFPRIPPTFRRPGREGEQALHSGRNCPEGAGTYKVKPCRSRERPRICREYGSCNRWPAPLVFGSKVGDDAGGSLVRHPGGTMRPSVFAAMAASAALTACATPSEPSVRLHPQSSERLGTAHRIGVVQPKGIMFELSAGGMREPKDEW